MSQDRAHLIVQVGPEDHILGSNDAPLTLVEYGDYECPYCGQAFEIVLALQRELGAFVRFVFRNLPLVKVHPHAEIAAEIAEGVGMQGEFWEMHDLLFENQYDLSEASILGYANRPALT